MKTWITKLKAVWGRGLPVQLPALLLAAGGAFWLAYANPSGAFSMLAMLGRGLSRLSDAAAKGGEIRLVRAGAVRAAAAGGDAVVLFHGRGDTGRHVCRAGAGAEHHGGLLWTV